MKFFKSNLERFAENWLDTSEDVRCSFDLLSPEEQKAVKDLELYRIDCKIRKGWEKLEKKRIRSDRWLQIKNFLLYGALPGDAYRDFVSRSSSNGSSSKACSFSDSSYSQPSPRCNQNYGDDEIFAQFNTSSNMVTVHWQGDYTDIHGDGRWGSFDAEIDDDTYHRICYDHDAIERLCRIYLPDCGHIPQGQILERV